MSLGAGDDLLHYRILSKVGEGGMGVVWKALDTKLDREVAIKVLPEAFSADAERLRRFEREAKLLASLNHPGIAGIYSLEEARAPAGDKPFRFLAMELVPGEDLAERLARGRLPVDEALDVARQIAAALEAAHGNGVIHRDLKPANVKLTPDGEIKVLDFGLAKTADVAPGSAGSASLDLSLSPTLTSTGTRFGTVLGTAAYMSPEQARGKPVDKRSDLWSFGCVLFECLTGVQLFRGETASDSIAAILTKDPDLSTLPATTPPLVRALVLRCLARDPRKRLQDAGDARVELELAIEDPRGEAVGLAGSSPASTASLSPASSRAARILPWAIAAGAVLVAAVLLLSGGTPPDEPTPEPEQVRRLTIPVPPGTVFDELGSSPPVISPDGRVVAYGTFDGSGDPRLWLRRLDRFGPKPLDGTEGAQFAFWSPDSRHLGFVQGGKLKRIDVETGLQQVLDIETSASGRGGSWSSDGKILIAPTANAAIQMLDAAGGGKPRPVTTLDSEIPDVSHRWPFFLPDGDHFLYVLWTNDLEAMEKHGGVYLASISGETPARRLLSDASSVAYVPPGYILVVRGDNLIAIPFDVATLQINGDASVIANGVLRHRSHGHAAFSASSDGTLVYAGGELSRPAKLTWFDREGNDTPAALEPAPFQNVRLARDAGPGRGRAAVVLPGANGDPEIWLLELDRGLHTKLISGSAAYDYPIFSRDGEEVLYAAQGVAGGKLDFYQRSADGSGTEAVVLVDATDKIGFDWSLDGRHIAYSPAGGWGISRPPEIWVYSIEEKTSEVVVAGDAVHWNARFSPDARWIAFDANPSGQFESYVQAFEAAGRSADGVSRSGARYRVSTAGGRGPHWRADGREIIYLDPERRIMAVDVEERGGKLNFGPPRQLFTLPGDLAAGDVTSDHQRFLFAIRDDVVSEPLYVVLNWQAGL